MNPQTITPHQAYEWLKNGEAILIDVREPEEFSASHIAYAQSLPLGGIEANLKAIPFPQNLKIITQCLSGKRGEKACILLDGMKINNPVFNIDGGISSWQAAGLPIIGNGGPKISIFRQVQMIIGTLIFLLILMGFLGITLAFVLAGLFAGALAFAGITGWCGLAMLLKHMPWNKS